MANNNYVYQQTNNVSIPKSGLLNVVENPELGKKDLRVLMLLLTELNGWSYSSSRKEDPLNYKTIHVESIADSLGLEKKDVKNSLKTLVYEGYLEIGSSGTVKDGYRFTF